MCATTLEISTSAMPGEAFRIQTQRREAPLLRSQGDAVSLVSRV